MRDPWLFQVPAACEPVRPGLLLHLAALAHVVRPGRQPVPVRARGAAVHIARPPQPLRRLARYPAVDDQVVVIPRAPLPMRYLRGVRILELRQPQPRPQRAHAPQIIAHIPLGPPCVPRLHARIIGQRQQDIPGAEVRVDQPAQMLLPVALVYPPHLLPVLLHIRPGLRCLRPCAPDGVGLHLHRLPRAHRAHPVCANILAYPAMIPLAVRKQRLVLLRNIPLHALLSLRASLAGFPS